MTDEEVMLKMRNICMQLRGQILHHYTEIELLIDNIILKDSELSFYMKIFEIKNLNSKIKSRIFKHCLEKYDKNYNKDTKDIRDKIDNITDKRHKFAHWVLDLTQDGFQSFKTNGVIRLVKPDNIKEFEQFKSDTYSNLQSNTYDLRNKLMVILKDINKNAR